MRRPEGVQKRGTDERRGWAVAWATMAAMIPSFPSISFFSQNLFVGPVTREFGWTNTQFLVPTSLAMIGGAILTPLIGFAADRWGPRRVVIPGVLLFGALTMALALSSSYASFFAIALAGGLASYGHSVIVYAKAVASWLSRRRGLAMAVCISGLAVGNMLFPPITQALIVEFGWRTAKVATGATLLLVSLPLVFLFVRERPTAVGVQHGSCQSMDMRLRDSIRTREFWQVLACFALGCAAVNGALANLVPIVETKRIHAIAPGSLLALMAACQFLGRLASGRLLDVAERPQVSAIWFMLLAIGLSLLALAGSALLVGIAAALLGSALGAEMEVVAYFVTRFFGIRYFGRIYGIMLACYTAASAIGPLIVSSGRATSGSYIAPLCAMIASSLIAALLLLFLPRYRFATQAI